MQATPQASIRHSKGRRHGQSAGPARSRTLHLDHPHVSGPAGAAGEVRVAAAARGARRPGRTRSAKSLDDAKQAKQELERLHVESARILARGAAEAEPIISRTRDDANRFREELKQKAQRRSRRHRQERREADRSSKPRGRCSRSGTKPSICR